MKYTQTEQQLDSKYYISHSFLILWFVVRCSFLCQHVSPLLNIEQRAECPQCFCVEIRQIFTFSMNLYCPKAHHRLDHSIGIVEYHRKTLLFLNSTFSPGLVPRTVLGFVTFASPVFSPQKQFCFWFRSSVALSYGATETIFTETRTQDKISGL
jgi:hypothetical protein